MILAWIALIVLAAWVGMIWYFGGGQWGRNQTQAIIDRLRRYPRVHAFLDRHHGKFRASFHYIEFAGMTLILYSLAAWMFGRGVAEWSYMRAAVAAVISAVAAYLDEVHQLRSGTRQFRRVDYLHSCCGIAIALMILRYAAFFAE